MKFPKVFSAIFTLSLFLVFFSNCSDIKELKITNIRNVEFKGMNDKMMTIDLTIQIENPNPYKLKVTDADIKVFSGRKEFGKVKQMSELTISRKSEKSYPLRVGVELNNVNDELLSQLLFLSIKRLDLRLTGSIKVKSLFYHKTIEVKDLKLIN